MTGFTTPSNCIVVKGFPRTYEKKIGDSSTYPGCLVKYSTTNTAVVCTAGANPMGWAGYEHTPSSYRPASVDTAFASGDSIAVLYGGDFVINAILATSQTITEGDLLIAGATGYVTESAATTATISETASTKHVTATITVAGSTPAGGPVVGRAMEDVTTTGSTSRLAVMSYL